jgi:hypothetical protein
LRSRVLRVLLCWRTPRRRRPEISSTEQRRALRGTRESWSEWRGVAGRSSAARGGRDCRRRLERPGAALSRKSSRQRARRMVGRWGPLCGSGAREEGAKASLTRATCRDCRKIRHRYPPPEQHAPPRQEIFSPSRTHLSSSSDGELARQVQKRAGATWPTCRSKSLPVANMMSDRAAPSSALSATYRELCILIDVSVWRRIEIELRDVLGVICCAGQLHSSRQGRQTSLILPRGETEPEERRCCHGRDSVKLYAYSRKPYRSSGFAQKRAKEN